jgi:hypothetical protein
MENLRQASYKILMKGETWHRRKGSKGFTDVNCVELAKIRFIGEVL